AEPLDREIVDADELDSGSGEQLRRIGRKVGEVLVKSRIGHPAVAAVARAEENALGAAPLVLVELRSVDRQRRRTPTDDAHRPDEALQPNLVERCTALDEVHRRIDMGARMRAEGESG